MLWKSHQSCVDWYIWVPKRTLEQGLSTLNSGLGVLDITEGQKESVWYLLIIVLHPKNCFYIGLSSKAIENYTQGKKHWSWPPEWCCSCWFDDVTVTTESSPSRDIVSLDGDIIRVQQSSFSSLEITCWLNKGPRYFFNTWMVGMAKLDMVWQARAKMFNLGKKLHDFFVVLASH